MKTISDIWSFVIIDEVNYELILYAPIIHAIVYIGNYSLRVGRDQT
jgi:hypothetical protein